MPPWYIACELNAMLRAAILPVTLFALCLSAQGEDAREAMTPRDSGDPVVQARMEAAARARREGAVLQAFYRAIMATASAHAKDPFGQARSFARGPMHAEVLQRVVDDLEGRDRLSVREVDAILERRAGQLREASYSTLTCLFVDARSWVKSNRTWVPCPLTPAQLEKVWTEASVSRRRDALAAQYATVKGKQVRSVSRSCRGCDGSPRSPYNTLGRIISSQEDVKPMNCVCAHCRGVGVVVTVRYR